MKLPYELFFTGSYRRGAKASSDIDVMLVSDSEDALEDIIKSCEKIFYKIYVYSRGKEKISFLIDCRNILKTNVTYKMDIFRSPIKSKIPMTIYSVGSMMFNIIMRRIAKQKGMLLNQHGLFKSGKRIDLKTEKAYFDYLDMDYRTYTQRNI